MNVKQKISAVAKSDKQVLVQSQEAIRIQTDGISIKIPLCSSYASVYKHTQSIQMCEPDTSMNFISKKMF